MSSDEEIEEEYRSDENPTDGDDLSKKDISDDSCSSYFGSDTFSADEPWGEDLEGVVEGEGKEENEFPKEKLEFLRQTEKEKNGSLDEEALLDQILKEI